MAFARVAGGKYTSGANGGTSGAFNAGSPDLIPVWVGFQGGSTVTLTSATPSLTWLRKDPSVQVPNLNLTYLACFYAYGSLGDCSAITFTLGGSSVFASLCWDSWTGAASSDPYVQEVSNASDVGGGGGQTISVGPITAATGNLLSTGLWAFLDASSGASINSSFNFRNGNDYVGGTAYPSAAADKISTGSAETPQWTAFSNQQYKQTMIIEFAAGGSATRGIPLGNEGTAFAGGRTFVGLLRRSMVGWRRAPSGLFLPCEAA